MENCYFNSLVLAVQNNIHTIAFPSISTGIYSFPVDRAAKIAVNIVRNFLKDNEGKIDLVEWVLFDDITASVYEKEVKGGGI